MAHHIVRPLPKKRHLVYPMLACVPFRTRTVTLNNLRRLSVPAMLALYDEILTFKCLRALAPKYPSSRFNTRASVHERNTRNKNMLDIPAFNTAAGQRFLIYRAVKCCNMLPEEITKCESLQF